jgi:D-threo-aldose 1-dehydrogenase
VPEIDYSYEGTLRSLEDSLQRLGLASVDLVLVHDPNRRWHGERWPERFREVMVGAHRA